MADPTARCPNCKSPFEMGTLIEQEGDDCPVCGYTPRDGTILAQAESPAETEDRD